MQIELLKTESKGFLSVNMDNNKEKYLLLMRILTDNNCILQKYYWRSIMDQKYIELIEPKISDGFNIIIDAVGSVKDLRKSLDEYNKLKHRVDLLPKL